MKVYVYKSTNKNRIKFFANEVTEQVACGFCLIGTLDLPIVPEKKEVVKREKAQRNTFYDRWNNVSTTASLAIPQDAYDIIVEYKVKE